MSRLTQSILLAASVIALGLPNVSPARAQQQEGPADSQIAKDYEKGEDGSYIRKRMDWFYTPICSPRCISHARSSPCPTWRPAWPTF